MTDAEHLVIGSGAGGALTAALLAESGKDVVVLEEGPLIEPAAVEQFSLEQRARQCRNGGMTVALGRPPIGYVEGCCAGGSTEVNAGLYRLASEERLETWSNDYRVRDLSTESLAPHARKVETSLTVQALPGAVTAASLILKWGADELGWPAIELPRCWSDRGDGPTKQSMSTTYLPRALAVGARLTTGARVDRLHIRRGRVGGAYTTQGFVRSKFIWVCCGAIGTAALLLRSGIHRGVGTALRVHPTVKLLARFEDILGSSTDVPVHQVTTPDRDVSLGGLVSSPGRVALTVADDWNRNRHVVEDWRRAGLYYAALRPEGAGRVRALRGLRTPIVTFRLTRRDTSRLATGLTDLARLLFAAGAQSVYPGGRKGIAISDPSRVDEVSRPVLERAADLMTFHLSSTTPMGEDESRCPVDSFGRVRGVCGLRVNDASLLPDAPGVNPQATVMAIASRNVDTFLHS